MSGNVYRRKSAGNTETGTIHEPEETGAYSYAKKTSCPEPAVCMDVDDADGTDQLNNIDSGSSGTIAPTHYDYVHVSKLDNQLITEQTRETVEYEVMTPPKGQYENVEPTGSAVKYEYTSVSDAAYTDDHPYETIDDDIPRAVDLR